MYVVIVEVHVLAEKVAEFLRLARKNHEGTRAESGNRRFDAWEVLLVAALVSPARVAGGARPGVGGGLSGNAISEVSLRQSTF